MHCKHALRESSNLIKRDPEALPVSYLCQSARGGQKMGTLTGDYIQTVVGIHSVTFPLKPTRSFPSAKPNLGGSS